MSIRYNEQPNAGYVKKWVTWRSLYLLTGCESILSSVAPISGCSVFSLDMPLGSNRVRQQSPVMSDRSGHAQQQGIIRCRAGVGEQGSCAAMESPEALIAPLKRGVGGLRQVIRCRAGVGGQGNRAAMESPKALMCPLKMGLAGLTSRHQTTGRVRVFAAANTWRTQRPRGASGFGTESQ